MHTRFRPRTQTLVVRWLLGLWLFAIAQSLVHACLLQPRHEHADPAPTQAIEMLSHLGHEADHGYPAPDASEALCLQTCDGAQSGAWSVNPPLLADLGLALSSAFSPWVQVCDATTSDQVEGVEPPGHPPPSIRFLRLNR